MTNKKKFVGQTEDPAQAVSHTAQADAVQTSTGPFSAIHTSTEAPSENDNPPPLDLEHLSKQTFGDKDLESEVLELFLSHSAKSIMQMKTAQTDKDWGEAMHSIKGSARTIGAWTLGHLAEYYEKNPLPDDVAAFEREKQKAASEIENMLKKVNAYISSRS